MDLKYIEGVVTDMKFENIYGQKSKKFMLSNFYDSALSQREWCKETGVCRRTLCRWLKESIVSPTVSPTVSPQQNIGHCKYMDLGEFDAEKLLADLNL